MSFALPWYPDRDFIEPAAEPTSPVEEEAKSEPIIRSAEYFFEDQFVFFRVAVCVSWCVRRRA